MNSRMTAALVITAGLLASACSSHQPQAWTAYDTPGAIAHMQCHPGQVEHCRVEDYKSPAGQDVLTCSCQNPNDLRPTEYAAQMGMRTRR